MRAVRKAFNQMLTSCLLAVAASPAIAQSPEMARLAKALAGDWSSVEVVQFGKPVPGGAGRKGATHVHLAGGGMVLVDEGHAVGTVGGDLQWFTSIWWDTGTHRYRMLTCFKASDANGCELRGTLHWVGDTLVNEYVEESTKMRDVWTDITPTSYTLTEEHDNGHGVMQPYVVSHITKMP
jgi:hypothetical protein